MATVAFTDLTIRNLKPGSYFDEKTPAFGIRIGKNRKTWIVIRGRERIRTRIGHYPALPLVDARKKALVLLGTPLDQQPVSTFAEGRELYLRTHCAQRQRARTRKETERLLTKHFASLDRKKLPAITTAHLSEILDGLLATPSEAQHAFKAARSFFRWAEARGYCKNPCTMSAPSRDQGRDRVLSDDELVRVYRAGAGQFGQIVRLLILTGQRRSEIAGLKGSYVDLAANEVSLPPDTVKNGRRHTFPLAPMAKGIVESLPATEGYLFPARRRETPFAGFSAAKRALDKACGVSDWTLHDLRRTFATSLAGLGIAPHVVERLLNHVTGSLSPIALRYNKAKYDKEMREALGTWERHLSALLAARDALQPNTPRHAV
jgi:integrase